MIRSVLFVHNRYLHRGGEAAAMEAERAMLERHGCRVDLFEESNERIAELGHTRTALKAIWSLEAARVLGERLDTGRYDLIHVHNFFPLLSPSIHHAAAARDVPVVQTLHNYRLFCLSPTPFRQGAVCRDCLGRTPWPGIVHRCYRGDRRASAAVAAMLVAHRALGTWRSKVSVFIALTEFARQRFIEAGLPAARLRVKANRVPDPGPPAERRERFALFVGRLIEAKGVRTLLAAWRRLDDPIPLRIVGDGPLAAEVAAAAAASPSIEWLGPRPAAEVQGLMSRCRLAVAPSESWENFPMVAAEALAHGTPFVTTTGGAVDELVRHGKSGLKVPPGRPEELAAAVAGLQDDLPLLERLGHGARREYETRFSEAVVHRQLMEIYEQAAAFIPGRL